VTARHLWYHAGKRRTARTGRALLVARACDAPRTIAMLSREPQKGLGWLSRWMAFLTTPFKFLGIFGWTDTGCAARASGSPVRDAQHSTDGFWTIDVELDAFRIGNATAEPPRFLRLEIEPGTPAHDVCSGRQILASAALSFGGPIVVDTDGPFLELHPDADFAISEIPAHGTAAAGVTSSS
jgi:hypothetical protein